MVLTVLAVPVLMGAFLLLMERFEARLLGVAAPWDVDDELRGPGQHFCSPARGEVRSSLPVNPGHETGRVISALPARPKVRPTADVGRFPQA